MARNQRLDATITIGSVLSKSFGKNIGLIKGGLGSVGDKIKEVQNRQKELSRQRRVLEREGRSVDALDREYEELGRTLDALRRKQENWERAARASNRVGRDFGRMTSEVGRFARRAAIGIGAVTGATFGLASSTAALGDDVAKTADKLGFGIEAYQELRYAAERSGVSVETFDSSMTAFAKRMGEAAQGTGEARKALDELGLSAEELVEMEPDQALGLIADRMQDIESPAERAAIAAKLFSRAGVGMVNMLRDGGNGLRDLRDDARQTGYVLSEEAARDSEVFQDTLLNLQLTFKGLKNTIGAELMPVVTRSMQDIGQYLRDNRDGVERFAAKFASLTERAVPVLGDLARGLGNVATKVGEGVAKVAEWVGGWDNLGAIIGTVLAGKALASIGGFAISVGKLGAAMWSLSGAGPLVAAGIRAIGAALMANPIGLVIAGIAGGAYLIWRNWDTIQPKLRAVVDKIGEGFTWVWENVISPVIDLFKAAGNGIVAAWETTKEKIGAVLEWIGAKFEWLASKISPVLEGIKWVVDKGVGALSALGIGGGGGVDPEQAARESASDRQSGLGADRQGAVLEAQRRRLRALGVPDAQLPPVQARAVGGAFAARRPLLVGERGPELMYPGRGGYVAHNRALERLAGLSDRVVRAGAREVAGAARQIVQNITINAQGLSAQQIADELDRRRRQAENDALFDLPAGYGQYGSVA